VGAVGIAEGKARIALAGGDGGHHHLRRRGTKAHDHHTDQQGRHAEVIGGGGGAVDKAVGTPHQNYQTHHNGGGGKHHERTPGWPVQSGKESPRGPIVGTGGRWGSWRDGPAPPLFLYIGGRDVT